MSLRNHFFDARVSNWGIDTIGAAAGLAIALALFPLRFFVTQVHVQTLPIVVGVASGLYLLLKRNEYGFPPASRWRTSPLSGHALRMATIVGLAGMIYAGTYTGGRTVPFFGVAAIVGTLVFAQIFFLRRADLRPGAILAQVVAFALIVRGMALVTTPGLIGVDSWIHIPEFASSVRQTGQLSAMAESHYYGTPLYHLLVVAAANAFDSSLRIALYATLGLVMPFSTVLLYYASRFFLPIRWALFAAAAFAVADHAVRWGLHLIPTSMGLVFFMAVFYGVGRIHATRESPAAYALVLLFAFATVFTHHISTFILLVFLGAGVVAQLYARLLAPRIARGAFDQDGATVNFVLLFAAVLPVTLVVWSLTPRDGSFLGGMIDTALLHLESGGFLELASLSIPSSELVGVVVTAPRSVQLLDLLGFSLLLFVALIGGFTLLRRDHLGSLQLTWINSTALMLVVILGLPLFGLYFLIPGRWYAFAYVPMVVLGAHGMSHLELNVPTRQLIALLVLFALLFPGAMLVNQQATQDNPIHEEYHPKFAYSESELTAAHTIATLHPEGATLRADHPYFLYFEDALRVTAEPLRMSEDGEISHAHVVYRDYQAVGGTQVEYEGTNVGMRLAAEQVCGPSMDVVYTNGEVRYCRAITP